MDSLKKQPLLNTFVNNMDMEETIQTIDSFIQQKKRSYIVAINVDVVIKIEQDAYLKRITDQADMVLVDGKPLIWISKLHKRPVKAKISGSDLVPKLCEKAAEKDIPYLLLVGKMVLRNRQKGNWRNNCQE